MSKGKERNIGADYHRKRFQIVAIGTFIAICGSVVCLKEGNYFWGSLLAIASARGAYNSWKELKHEIFYRNFATEQQNATPTNPQRNVAQATLDGLTK